MATQAQKEEILFMTKQINSLKLKRNRCSVKSKKKALQSIIDVAEKDLNAKRNYYKIPLK
jgi:hypothetical protein